MTTLIAELRNLGMFIEMIALVGLFTGAPFWIAVVIEAEIQSKRRN